jgi:mRNA interferase RelE/StbE
VRTWKKLPPDLRKRMRSALEKLARDVTSPGRVGGKGVKTIQGTRDSFHRLRVGDYRIVYDVIEDESTLLVLGIVHRSDLERWIRNR